MNNCQPETRHVTTTSHSHSRKAESAKLNYPKKPELCQHTSMRQHHARIENDNDQHKSVSVQFWPVPAHPNMLTENTQTSELKLTKIIQRPRPLISKCCLLSVTAATQKNTKKSYNPLMTKCTAKHIYTRSQPLRLRRQELHLKRKIHASDKFL